MRQSHLTKAAVLAAWDEGPMLRYWSGRPVIAGPYHRNIEGILDTMRAHVKGGAV